MLKEGIRNIPFQFLTNLNDFLVRANYSISLDEFFSICWLLRGRIFKGSFVPQTRVTAANNEMCIEYFSFFEPTMFRPNRSRTVLTIFPFHHAAMYLLGGETNVWKLTH